MPLKSNLRLIRALAALVLLSSAYSVLGADAPAAAPAGAPAARRGGPPAAPITPAEQADIDQLGELPAWTAGAGDGS